MHPLTIVSVYFIESGLVAVTTANGAVKNVTVDYLNGCTGCDVVTLNGAVGQIWD